VPAHNLGSGNECRDGCVNQSDRRTGHQMKDDGSRRLTIRAGERMQRREQTREISDDFETVNKTTNIQYNYRPNLLTPTVAIWVQQ